METDRQKQRKNARRELLHLQVEEKKLREAAGKAKPVGWKSQLEKKIPPKVYDSLVQTFSLGFSLVFQKGRKLIEKTYNKEFLQEQHMGSTVKQMRKNVKRANGFNMTATTAEGSALGLLGVGVPDIVLFLSTLLKGVYETALNYGFTYESRQEQYWILLMMSASLSSGKDWELADKEVEELLTEENIHVTEEVLNAQIKETAAVFAMDMLLLKFIQGMPVVGFLGGAANPLYYNKVMRYVQLKYKKRYLLKQLGGTL